MSTPFFQAFVEIIALFEELESNHNLPYMLIWGILTPIYAESRQTQDIDVLAHIQVNEKIKTF